MKKNSEKDSVLGGDKGLQACFSQTDHGGSELITAETEGLRSVEISNQEGGGGGGAACFSAQSSVGDGPCAIRVISIRGSLEH